MTPDNVTFISEVATHCYGIKPDLQPLDGFTNEVYRLDFASVAAPKVIKVSRIAGMAEEGYWGGCGEILREQEVIRSLAERGFEVPHIEFTQEDYSSPDVPFTIMPFYAGQPLCETYQTNPEAVSGAIKRIGEFIARLSAIDYAELPVGFTPRMVKKSFTQWWGMQFEAFRKHRLCSPRLEDALRRGQELIEREPAVLGNNDGVQCITDSEGGFVVIDWGPSGASWPLADLATSSDNRVTARTVTYVSDHLDIFFLSWAHHTKCVQIRDNPRVALCKHNLEMEGMARILGNPLDPVNSKYADIFKKRVPEEFGMFSSQDGMVMVRVVPTRVIALVNVNDWLYLETLDVENGKACRRELPA